MVKLVRDLIPQIMVKRGQNPNFYIADNEEYEKRLFDKLSEEVKEMTLDHSIDEFADVMEVLESIRQLKKFTWEEIENVQRNKREQRGGFGKRYILMNGER